MLKSIAFLAGLVLLLLIAPSIARADYVSEVRQDKPLVWLRFADASAAEGAVAADAMGLHPGRYHGGVHLVDGPTGPGGRAARFDGRSGTVEIPDSPALALNSLTVEFWFQSRQRWDGENWPASATLVSKATPNDGSSDWAVLGGSAAAGQGCVMARPGPQPGHDLSLSAGPGLNDGQWHYLGWTRSAAGQNRLYVDGVLSASGDDGGGRITNTRPIQIGGDPWLGGKFLEGAIADVAIYGHVLSPDRMAAHASAGGAKPGTQRVVNSPGAIHPLRLALNPATFRPLVESFHQHDRETTASYIPDAEAWDWMKENVPLFECPDKDIQQIYYFRWWTYRKHIRSTPAGFVVDEFLPLVGWAGNYNTISCAAGHHFYEGRWINNPEYLDDYAKFWFRGGGEPRRYSFWAADALYARYLVDHDAALITDLLPDLVRNYDAWKDHLGPNGLYWQVDDRDGMEVSIGGSGYRATINSYQYGDAVAISRIAELAGQPNVAARFLAEAARIKALVQEKLWNPADQFFEVLPQAEEANLVGVRELHGYTPWYFNLPDAKYSVAWKQLMDPQGFYAPFGPTTAERRSPRFMFANPHECLWNGPSWPFATSITLTALANLLDNYQQDSIDKKDYLNLLQIYAKSQHLKLPDGTVVPWIDEDLNPDTGDWTARTILAKAGTHDRGKDYNHSTFCDLVISGLVGLRPRADDTVEVDPLVPPGTWAYFCLDGVHYHGRWLTILYDRTGERYHRGKGLRVFADGQEIASSEDLGRLTAPLPPLASQAPPLRTPAKGDTAAGWVKYAGNPVLGGKLGTCFDVSLLKEETGYRMWFSWRPRKSIALVESPDGIHWSEPRIVLGPDPASGWEDDINRPGVLKRWNTYFMWYTGQTNGRSAIGLATSPDGLTWTRQSVKPVLSAEEPWEKTAVMCPDVLWDSDAKLFKMWYSGGEQYEPNAIGYATSPDGLTWTRHGHAPIFTGDPAIPWEKDRVTACQVVHQGAWYVMFYLGFRDVDHAQIGIARSRDGITGWERLPANPIIRPGEGTWDADSCYKPYAIFDGKQWMLWYNGRRGGMEQIGLATHAGEGLGFR